MSALRGFALCTLCLVAAACGDDNDGRGSTTPTPLPTQTTAPTAVATATAPDDTVTPTVAAPTPTPTDVPAPGAVARRIEDATDLIGGTLATGRVGDYLIANDRIRAIVRQPGREMSLALTYGGNIVDADLVRPPGQPGQDNFGGMTPNINLSLTINVQDITIVNDGADGGPAILRASGVDDLFDAFDLVNVIKSFGFGSVPPSARDVDLPLEIANEFTLGTGDDAIRIETILTNVGDEDLQIYVGDLLNASGEDDTFVPSLGFGDALLRGEMPYVAFPGRGSNKGVSYGIIVERLPGTELVSSSFGQSGIMGYLLGQSFLDVLLVHQPGVLSIPAGGSNSFVRYFAVGDGDVGSIADIHTSLLGLPAGTVSGVVTVAGNPAADAFISVAQKPGEADVPYNVISSFRTDQSGHYEGSLPVGDYLVLAKLDGHLYEGGSSTATEHPITVTEGSLVQQDIQIPPPGRLRVTVVDEMDRPIPAKSSLVGFDPAPEPGNGAGTFLFRTDTDNRGAELFGLTDVRFIDASGDSGEFPIAPSEYEIVVSRGPEYSVHRERITVGSGEVTTVTAKLVRVLETTGFVATDYHVHMVNSWDSTVTRDKRILTMVAEGVDYFVASDHDFVTDIRPDIERLGLTELIAASVSAEVTTFDLGHFNAWPLERDANAYTGGSIDWGRAGVPAGKDFPSLGSYDLSPTELFEATRNRMEPGHDLGVIQANHFNSPTLGYFTLAGIDTALDPPQSFTDPALIRQDPSVGNLYDDNVDALEVWIEASRTQTDRFLTANLGDWFNLLNQGRIKAGTSDSDTHDTAIIQAGGPRNFVAASTDLPPELDDAELVQSVKQGRLLGSNAPFLTVTLSGDGDATAGLALGESLLVPATSGSVVIGLRVQSPAWAAFDTIYVFANTVPVPLPDENLHGVDVPRYQAEPTLTLRAGQDFEIQSVIVDANTPGAARLEANLEIPLTIDRDTWLIVMVQGSDDVSPPIWPMNPQDLDQEGNATLDDLTDGNLGEGGNPALAFTNPLYADFDGNGRFDPSGQLP